MRIILSLAILSLVFISTSPAAENQVATPQVSGEVDAINYSLGYDLGEKIALYELDLRSDILWQGLVDALEQKETPQLTPAAMQAILTRFETELQVKQAAKNSSSEAPVQGFRLPGQEFLAWNAQQPGVQSLPGGLQYLVLKEGSGEMPVAGDKVLVTYRATDIDGKEFDSSAPQGISAPRQFNIDKLMPGLSQALKMMPVGSTWRIFIPTALAYRDSGPMAGQTVIYDLELLEVLPKFQ